MARDFLSSLLRIESSVQSDGPQQCMVCLQEIGSLSSETGIIECQVRLPCNHLVGSHCIATWLHDNNTCPVCRSVFFPAQPQPHLEHGRMLGEEDDEAPDDDSEDYNSDDSDDNEERVVRLERSTYRLGLNYAGRLLALQIAGRAFHMEVLRGCTGRSIGAVSIFVASHLARQPLNMEQVSTVMQINPRRIRDTYIQFYPERETVIDRESLFLLREDPQRATRGDLPSLAWPPPEYVEEWRTDAFWQRVASQLEISPAAILIVVELSRTLMLRLTHRPYLHGHDIMEIAALSIYLASFLRDIPLSCEEIASATGVSEDDIRTIYALFYPHRQDLHAHRRVNTIRRIVSLEVLSQELPTRLEQ